MAVSATPDKVTPPYVHQVFPKWAYSQSGSKLFTNQVELEEQLAKDGPDVWFDSPAKVPAPTRAPQEDWQAKHAALEAELAELRKTNGDLVAKLFAKPAVDKK